MSRSCQYGVTCGVLLVMTMLISAQGLKTNRFAVGVAGGAVLGDMDFGRDEDPGFQLTAFIRHSIFGPLEGQMSGNFFGKLMRKDANSYETEIISGDYRLLLRPIATNVFSLYVYGGAGGLYYEVTRPPANPDAAAKDKEWVGFAPVGGGFQIKLVEQLSLDINGGYNFAFTDDLNLVRAGDNDDGYFNAAAGLTFTLESADADPDVDGLTNKEEKRIGTNKRNPDTDGDGLNDGEEFNQYRTNPLSKDTDTEGLTDFEEIRRYNTNPRKADSDGDGLSDTEEVLTHKTNPLKKDTDGDRLSDRDEIVISKTDPRNPDTDSDGLDDGAEITQYKTDPKNADSDLDGLKDGEEVLTLKTDPLNPDTDGGTVNDGTEFNRGTDPLDPTDDVVLEVKDVGDKVVLEGIIFALNSARISKQSELILEKAYQTLLVYSEMVVEISGHTDITGTRSYNMLLSQRRADAVRDYLIRRGIDPSRMVARGYGPDYPVASNSYADGRARNRRIEFKRIR